jgi:hypothetical protein
MSSSFNAEPPAAPDDEAAGASTTIPTILPSMYRASSASCIEIKRPAGMSSRACSNTYVEPVELKRNVSTPDDNAPLPSSSSSATSIVSTPTASPPDSSKAFLKCVIRALRRRSFSPFDTASWDLSESISPCSSKIIPKPKEKDPKSIYLLMINCVSLSQTILPLT